MESTESWRASATRLGAVTVLSTADFNAALWTNKQHIASRLSDEADVLYVESLAMRSPRFTAADFKRAWRRLRGLSERGRIADNRSRLTIVSPLVVPAHGNKIAARINRRLMDIQVGRRVDEQARPRVLWSFTPLAADVLDLSKFDVVLYHCVDDLGTVPGVSEEVVERTETTFIPQCDLVITSSPTIRNRIAKVHPRTHFLHNVIDAEHFAKACDDGDLDAEIARLPGPRAIFVGALSDHKIDWALMAGVATRLSDVSFVLVGPFGDEERSTESDPVLALDNVYWFGKRDYADLPSALAAGDVGIIPYRLTTHTASVFPMKTLEYLAAGLPVVSTDLESLRAVPELAVAKALTAESFAREIRRAVESHDRTPDPYALASTWDSLLDRILNLIEMESVSS